VFLFFGILKCADSHDCLGFWRSRECNLEVYCYLFLLVVLNSTKKICSSEGVQVGGLRSAFGVLGSWTTIFHDADDPVGKWAKSSI